MINTKQDLTNYITAVWEEPLRREGFARMAQYHTTPNEAVSVQDEMDSLAYYYKLVSFYYTTEFYEGIRRAYVREHASPYFDLVKLDHKAIIPSGSYIQKAMRNICILYSMGANRFVVDANGDMDEVKNDKLYEYVDATTLDMRSIEEYNISKLCGVVAIRTDFDTEKKKIVVDMKSPAEFRVKYDDNFNVTKYAFSCMREIKGMYQHAIEVYTKDEHYILDATGMKFGIDNMGQVVPADDGTTVNELGFIPVVFWRSNFQEFYSSDMHNLVEACIKWNYTELLRELDQTFAANNMILMVNTGVGEADADTDITGAIKVDVGTRNAVVIDELQDGMAEPRIEVVTNSPHSEVLTENMNNYKRESLINEGLSASNFSDTVTELSGRAIKSMKEELLQIRDTDKTLYTQQEKEKLAMMARVVNFYVKGAGLPEDPDMYDVDYVEEQFDDVDPLKDLEYDIKAMEIGLISPLDVMSKYNGDIDSVEDAVKTMARNRNDFLKIKSRLNIPSIEPVQDEEQDTTKQKALLDTGLGA